MANKMIIDASHPEETRVVVLRGNRVEEFDFELANKRPLRGNIYLAKVTRVEPSLQAAFVDYGGNRHGFLAFSEIYPDYYQIPIADRQALLEEEARSQRDEEDEPNGERRSRRHRRPRRSEVETRVSDEEALSEPAAAEEQGLDENEFAAESPTSEEFADSNPAEEQESGGSSDEVELTRGYNRGPTVDDLDQAERETAGSDESDRVDFPEPDTKRAEAFTQVKLSHDQIRDGGGSHPDNGVGDHAHDVDDREVTTLEGGSEERFAPDRKDRLEDEGEPVEQIGGDAMEELPRRPQRTRRQYKI